LDILESQKDVCDYIRKRPPWSELLVKKKNENLFDGKSDYEMEFNKWERSREVIPRKGISQHKNGSAEYEEKS
jgi:hypothetical protein